jgi:cardiolipin synthase A/B
MLIAKTPYEDTPNITLVHSGEDYFSRLERIILESKTEIHLQTYIFEWDATGQKIISALKVAASRKVKIYILLDGFGSLSFSKEGIKSLSEIGIDLRFFAPIFSTSFLYIGRRLHHKIVVSDSKIALIGGINIADKYHGTKQTEAWLDYAAEIHDENIALSLRELCSDIYFKKRIIRRKKIISKYDIGTIKSISILQNDWLKRKNEVFNAYITTINSAKKEIILVSSYFLPGKKLTKSLINASKRGVKTQLILSGLSDVPMVKRASTHLYTKLLRNGIELYEWKNTVLHGKTAIIDNNWTTIGSFNLNNLSSFASIELNVAQKYALHLMEIRLQCSIITFETLELTYNWCSKLTNWLSYWISRVAEIIITYIPHKRFRKLY